MSGPGYVRGGRGAVRPYLYGHFALERFVAEVFGAETTERHEFPNGGVHWEGEIADSSLVIELMETPPKGHTASVYVYVPDVDGAYDRALALGATSLAAPEQKPYAERACAVQDVSGNTWYIASYTG